MISKWSAINVSWINWINFKRNSSLLKINNFLLFKLYSTKSTSKSIIVRSIRYWIRLLTIVHSIKKNSFTVRFSIRKAFKIRWYFSFKTHATVNWFFNNFSSIKISLKTSISLKFSLKILIKLTLSSFKILTFKKQI